MKLVTIGKRMPDSAYIHVILVIVKINDIENYSVLKKKFSGIQPLIK